MLLFFKWGPHSLGTLSIRDCPQPNVDASVVISIAGLVILHAVGTLVTHQLRSLTDSEGRVIVAS